MAAAFDYILEPIRDGVDFTLYRGRKRDNSTPVLVVAPAGAPPRLRSLQRIEHEYALSAELEHSWAARPIALTRHEGRTILVIEDPGGDPLDRILEREQPLDPARFLRIAIGMASALGHVHQRGLIHKDIKPENVLANGAGDVWLTGFGIASRLPRERQDPTPPEIVSGTLAYMSPEQTGRMNRSIDARSDLYSLGVTLYQMLTGVLPFAAGEPMEWVYCHIARQPIAPVNRRAVPELLSIIIMKLLAKNAEDRYQTAAGLEADLRRCLAALEASGEIEAFALGERDHADHLLIPERLYGRKDEIDALVGAFDQVVQDGLPRFILVRGRPGIGKSSVINELHKVLVPSRGLFASGKFDQRQRDVPYATLAQALRGLVRPLLLKPEEELAGWREKIANALESNGALLLDLIPELRHVLGELPPVAELPAAAAQARFRRTLRRAIAVFAQPEHPLALFLDDLQWLDVATLGFLEELVLQSDVRHLLLVGAYRDSEVDAAHPLIAKIEALHNAGADIREITLAPLREDDLASLIEDTLRCAKADAMSLARLVHAKTGGNPFFAGQFLHELVDEGVVGFDPASAQWRWETAHIEAKGYTENVADFMIGKLGRAPQQTCQALKELACLGNMAKASTLAIVHERPLQELDSDLWEALRSELIVRAGDTVRFGHDRVQEAAYALIPEADRSREHLRIGRLLLARLGNEDRDEALFDIVDQLHRGAALIESEDERATVAELHLAVALRAKAAVAYASALNYAASGAGLLPPAAWQRRHDLAFELEILRAECEFHTGQMTASRERLETMVSHAAGAVERCAVASLLTDVLFALQRPDLGIGTCVRFLHEMGVDIGMQPSDAEARAAYDQVRTRLGQRPIESLADLPAMVDSAARATVSVLAKLSTSCLPMGMNFFSLVICSALELTLEHGNTDSACLIFAYAGIMVGWVFEDMEAALRFNRLGWELVHRPGMQRYESIVRLTYAIQVAWTRHIASCVDDVRVALNVAERSGDPFGASVCRGILVSDLLAVGEPLPKVQAEAEISLAFARKVHFGDFVNVADTQAAFIRNLRGLAPRFGTLDDERFSEAMMEALYASQPHLPLNECWYFVRKLQARYSAGDYTAALAAGLRAQELLWLSNAMFEIAECEFYTALTHAALCESASEDERRQHLEAAASLQRRIELRARHCPQNFEDRAILVAAEIARFEGHDPEAMRLYDRALRSARENGFVHNEALSNELAARFYLSRGFDKIARAYLDDARDGYLSWGADGKVAQLEALYPQQRSRKLRAQSEPSAPTVMIDKSVAQFDAETVVKASQTLSSEMNLPSLIAKVMRLAIEHAGAERGLLILIHDDGPRIEAEARAGLGSVEISTRQQQVTPIDLPQSALQYVLRTHERVLMDDAGNEQPESKDEYFRHKHPRSVLSLPILKQTKLIGLLYLENNLTAHAFTSGRVAVLDVLASQAAISLENARLYSDLQRSEAFLSQGQRISQTGSFGWGVASGEIYWSEGNYRILEYDPAVKPSYDLALQRVHPDDLEFVQHALEHAAREKADFDFEHRLFMPDGRIKHVHIVGRAMKNETLDFVGAITDVTAAKMAEEKIRQSESELRQILDVAPQHVYVLGPEPASTRFYVNQSALDYLGLTLEQWRACDQSRLFHPDDWQRTTGDAQRELTGGLPHETEVRLPRADGKYRWFLLRWNPLRDEHGRLNRWYVAGTDIEELKLAEQKLQRQNISLREEIDRASMFEEIVGTSEKLRAVLAQVVKVAPTESTVLITGNTGTGKELFARAIHRRSLRSRRAFIAVNCASIPPSLIATELFGHEKGAFTGATAQRVGRFELADGGTIFLDEVGELPHETQVALLRVLQERQVERIGGNGPIGVDVRVIAATNRDLTAAVAGGTFRQDLFYRLNVFPLRVPSLSERAEDIPVLVEYFVGRFADRMGKRIKNVEKNTMNLFQRYGWPGNVRELQNVVERAVILSEGETLCVEEAWFPSESQQRTPRAASLKTRLVDQEKDIIEAALSECRGRVSGPSGAAAKLGIPAATLESKIRSMGINKHQFKK